MHRVAGPRCRSKLSHLYKCVFLFTMGFRKLSVSGNWNGNQGTLWKQWNNMDSPNRARSDGINGQRGHFGKLYGKSGMDARGSPPASMLYHTNLYTLHTSTTTTTRGPIHCPRAASWDGSDSLDIMALTMKYHLRLYLVMSVLPCRRQRFMHMRWILCHQGPCRE